MAAKDYLSERKNVYRHALLDSTNLEGKRMAASGAPDGTVIIAAQQSAGRGRMGRSFQSAGGVGLYLSILWRPGQDASLLALPALGAVAAARAVEEACGLSPEIKWPNDLVLGGRKLAGILCESVVLGAETAVILGIGINVGHTAADFEGEVADIATSLAMAGAVTSPEAVADALVWQLDELRERILLQPGLWREEYRRRCATLGREVRLIGGEESLPTTALDVDEEYGLVVRLAGGEVRTVRAGEVSVRGLYGYAP